MVCRDVLCWPMEMTCLCKPGHAGVCPAAPFKGAAAVCMSSQASVAESSLECPRHNLVLGQGELRRKRMMWATSPHSNAWMQRQFQAITGHERDTLAAFILVLAAKMTTPSRPTAPRGAGSVAPAAEDVRNHRLFCCDSLQRAMSKE